MLREMWALIVGTWPGLLVAAHSYIVVLWLTGHSTAALLLLIVLSPWSLLTSFVFLTMERKSHDSDQ